ncbi:MAG: HD domain-containing protein [Bacteriovoracaceae bacterium]|nr:HD domain-containing protein [Bacteriovoracaceae bacterium]
MALKVILAEPDDTFAGELTAQLKNKGFEVLHAPDGKEAQLALYETKKVMAIIIDHQIQKNSSFEVLKYTQFNYPNVKVIFTFADKKNLKDLDFTEEEMFSLGVDKILYKPYPCDKLINLLEESHQHENWKKISENPEQKTKTETGSPENIPDEQFTKIMINEFVSGKKTIFDHYVRLSKNKYIKVLHKGDSFDKERIMTYLEKGTDALYFKTKDRGTYINFINATLKKLIDKENIRSSIKVAATKSAVEKYLEEVSSYGLKPQIIDEGKKLCDNVFSIIKKEKDLYKLMCNFEEVNPANYSHQFLISFFASAICTNLRWNSPVTTETVVMGAMLHDLGKLKLPPELQKMAPESMNKVQLAKYQEHPRLGYEMLDNYPLINEPVKLIVLQHHEYINGEGFPQKLTGIKIYPLAKIVSLANYFVDIIAQQKIMPLDGLRTVIPQREFTVKFDPDVIRAFVKSFCDPKKLKHDQ